MSFSMDIHQVSKVTMTKNERKTDEGDRYQIVTIAITAEAEKQEISLFSGNTEEIIIETKKENE